MASYHDILEIPTLLRVVEAFPPDSSWLMDQFASEGEVFETEEIEIQTKKGHRPLAPYVNELLPGKVVLRSGWTSKTWKPALLKPMRVITRHDLKVKQAGETLINPKTPEERYQELVTQDLAELIETIDRRKMQQLSDIMFKGTTEQIGEGVHQVLDWEFTNKTILSGDDLFSNPTTDVLAFLEEWKLAVMRKSGKTPTKLLATADVATRIMRHETVLALIKTDNTAVITPGQLNQQIQAGTDGVIFHGYLAQVGLSVWSYTNSYTDEEGVEVPYIPEGTLALLPEGKPFQFMYGANLVGEDDNIKLARAKIFPQVFFNREPVSRKLQLLSKPICVPENVDGWYVAKVL
ncbi:major capsid protein [Paenibacillus hubeiensis]|uniref:major capsid protein n=1 Tax=Paenibacillus hubeiensis TaxID=3077330 RepID=UPI0031B9F789